MFFLLLDTYTVGKRIREVAAEDLTLRAGLQEVLQAVAVDGGLQLRHQLPVSGRSSCWAQASSAQANCDAQASCHMQANCDAHAI